jgi:hypothetical protein
MLPQFQSRQFQTPSSQNSAFSDTPRDHLHVTPTTRSVRKSRSAPWRTKEDNFSELAKRSTLDGFPPNRVFFEGRLFRTPNCPQQQGTVSRLLRRDERKVSPLPVRKDFSVVSDDDAIPFGIGLLLNVDREINARSRSTSEIRLSRHPRSTARATVSRGSLWRRGPCADSGRRRKCRRRESGRPRAGGRSGRS